MPHTITFEDIIYYINIYDPTTFFAIIFIIICPITWNIVARYEFKTKRLTNLCGNNKYLAADVFAHILIEMGIVRNYLFLRAISTNEVFYLSDSLDTIVGILSTVFMIVGFIINVGSYWQLGIHGIYYADYFGVLMDSKVTDFPYNILDNPLYLGSEILFYSISFKNRSVTGIVLSVLAQIMYNIASYLEMPMTELIYSKENMEKVSKENKLIEYK